MRAWRIELRACNFKRMLPWRTRNLQKLVKHSPGLANPRLFLPATNVDSPAPRHNLLASLQHAMAPQAPTQSPKPEQNQDLQYFLRKISALTPVSGNKTRKTRLHPALQRKLNRFLQRMHLHTHAQEQPSDGSERD